MCRRVPERVRATRARPFGPFHPPPPHLYNPKLYKHGYTLPPASWSPSISAEEAANSSKTRRQARASAIAGVSVDEVVIEPPHHPDETIPAPYVRPCSMGRTDVPSGFQCVIMLEADHDYRMCESCRMPFKLDEAKYKAKETPEDREAHLKHKPRPQLTEYNGELILDPVYMYMHTYKLDPRMFGLQAVKNNTVAKAEAKFNQALKNASNAVFRNKSAPKEASAAARQSAESFSSPTTGPSTSSELVMAMPHLSSPVNDGSPSHSCAAFASSSQASTSAV